jgi:hypothetical protein
MESTEVAGLKISVDATSADAGSVALDRFVASATRADAATNALKASQSANASQTKAMTAAITDATRATGQEITSSAQLIQKLKDEATAANAAANAEKNLASAQAATARARDASGRFVSLQPTAAPTLGRDAVTSVAASAAISPTGGGIAAAGDAAQLEDDGKALSASAERVVAAETATAAVENELKRVAIIRTGSLTNSVAESDRAAKSFLSSAGNSAVAAAQTKQMSGAYDDVSRAAQHAEQTLSPLTLRLQDQVATFDKSPAEIAAYRAGIAGLSQEETALAVGLANRLHALQLGEEEAKAAAKAEIALGTAVKASGGAVQVSSLQIRESLTILRELSQGRYSRIPGSFSLLAQQGNLAALAMQALSNPLVVVGIAATATAATIGLLTYQAEKAAESVKLIETALAATGKSALLTGTQIRQAIDDLQQLHGVNNAEATAATDALVRAPFIDQAQFAQAKSIVGDLAAALGVKLPEAAKALSNAMENPIEGLHRLQQAHIALTPDQEVTITALHKEGKEAEATAALLDALTKNLSGIARDGLTPLQQASTNFGNAWHGLMTNLSDSGAVKGATDLLTGLLNGLSASLEAARLIDAENQKSTNRGLRQATLDYQAQNPQPGQPAAAPITGSINRSPLDTAINKSIAAKVAEAAASARAALVFKQEFDRVEQLTQGYETQAEKIKQLQAERAVLQKGLDTPGFLTTPTARGEVQKQIAGIDEQLSKKDDHGFKEKQLALTQEITKATEELQAATSGVALVENKNVQALATWLAYSKDANKIGAARVAILLREAEQADKLTLLAKIPAERKAIVSDTEGVQAETSRLQGNTAESALDSFHKKYDQTLIEMQARVKAFKDAGLEDLTAPLQVFEQSLAKQEQLVKVVDQATQTENAAALAEKANATIVKTAQVEETAGYISNAAAVQQVRAADDTLADTLATKVVPGLQTSLAALVALGDGGTPAAEKLRDEIGELDLKILELKTHTSELTTALKGAFESSVSSALDGIIEHTETANQAVKNIEKSLEHAFVSTFTKGLVNDLSTSLFRPATSTQGGGGIEGERPSGFAGLFPSVASFFGLGPKASNFGVANAVIPGVEQNQGRGGGIGNIVGDLEGAAGGTPGGSAAPISAAFTTGSAAVSSALAAAFASGATTLADAITESLSGANPSNVSGGDLGPLFGLGGNTVIPGVEQNAGTGGGIGNIVDGFASGGYTGSGATHEPAGIVHGQEFVNRAEVVKQPGALSFLSDFNDRGMQAVAGYAGGGFVKGVGSTPTIVRLQGYAAGGVVSRADTLPAAASQAAGGAQSSLGATINTALDTGGQQAGGTISEAMAQGGAIAGQTIASSILTATQPGTGLSAGGSNTYSKDNNDKGIFGLVMAAAGLASKSIVRGSPSTSIAQGNAQIANDPQIQALQQSPSLAPIVIDNGPGQEPTLYGHATGGYTGDGGKYEPAGIVHAGEFVHRQEVVRQPGAMQFLTAFNEKGMAAVSSWGGYARGGIVTVPSPLQPAILGGDRGPAPMVTNVTHRDLSTDAISPLGGYSSGGFVYPGGPTGPESTENLAGQIAARTLSVAPVGYATGGLVVEPRMTPVGEWASSRPSVAGSAYAVPRTFAGYADGGFVAPSINMPSIAMPRTWNAQDNPGRPQPRRAGQGAQTEVNLVLSPEMAHQTVGDLIDRHLSDAFSKR